MAAPQIQFIFPEALILNAREFSGDARQACELQNVPQRDSVEMQAWFPSNIPRRRT
ncbi:hypothetical protein SK128_014358 [Halocaridina rubra]|uniref:Uncharacterized protein n=1 Tax=Halocaridina rubra TaxID=373956 RepID=A0AAN8X4G1_HALRR